MEMDLDFACNKYVPQIFIDEMRKLVLYKEIKDSTEYHLHVFTFRDGTQIFAKISKKPCIMLLWNVSVLVHKELFMRCSTNYDNWLLYIGKEKPQTKRRLGCIL